MSDNICCCAVTGVLGSIRNRENTGSDRPPELVMGLPCELRLRLFANCTDTTAYPVEQFADVRGWSFEMDTDFSSDSPVKIVADNADIVLSEVTEGDTTYTQIAIPISNTHTAELAAALDGKESIMLTGELTGYDVDHAEIFVLQLKGFTVRGRIAGIGEPTPIPTAAYEELASRTLSAVLSSRIDAVSGGLQPGLTSGGAEQIASGAALSIISGGGYISGGDVEDILNASALPKNKPFSTTVGGYTIELTSGGVSIYGSGASVTLSGGEIQASATQGFGAIVENYDAGIVTLISAGESGTGIYYNDTENESLLQVGGTITANGSAITQVSSGIEDTSLEIDHLEGGVKYICSSALSELSIGSAGSGCNGAIIFMVASGAIVTPPANVPYFGVTNYTAGSSYLMMINDFAAVCNEAAIPVGV